MKKELVLIMFIILLGIPLVQGQIFLGTVQGLIINTTGGNVSGASVNATVIGKTGAGSSGVTTSDSGGFYIITNLNTASGDTIQVSANLSNKFGQSNVTANAFGNGEVNVTLAEVPFPPNLVPIADTHNNTLIVFNWTSGTDPQALSTFDIWTLVTVEQLVDTDPPINKTFLDFRLYTWTVETCNAFGCSSKATDVFNLTNSPPPAPILQDVPDGASNLIIFNWTSGGADPDGDDTFFIFQLDSDAQQINVTPPLNDTVTAANHTWRVKECDNFECSTFSTDTFEIANAPATTPSLTLQNHTTQTSVQLFWTSGTDPEGAATFDELQINDDPIVSPATSGATVSLSGVESITWKVRTCDVSKGCSAFNSSTFIKFQCVAVGVAVPVTGGGGGGSPPVRRVIPGLVDCVESWSCVDWDICGPEGFQIRQCFDENNCASTFQKPREKRLCTPAHCSDGIRNHDESGVDCGGERCSLCPAVESPLQIIFRLRDMVMDSVALQIVFAVLIALALAATILFVFFNILAWKLMLYVRLKIMVLSKAKVRKGKGSVWKVYKKIHKEINTQKKLDREIMKLMKQLDMK